MDPSPMLTEVVRSIDVAFHFYFTGNKVAPTIRCPGGYCDFVCFSFGTLPRVPASQNSFAQPVATKAKRIPLRTHTDRGAGN